MTITMIVKLRIMNRGIPTPRPIASCGLAEDSASGYVITINYYMLRVVLLDGGLYLCVN